MTCIFRPIPIEKIPGLRCWISSQPMRQNMVVRRKMRLPLWGLMLSVFWRMLLNGLEVLKGQPCVTRWLSQKAIRL